MAKSKLEIYVTATTDKAVQAMNKLGTATGDVDKKAGGLSKGFGILDGVMLSLGGMAVNMGMKLAKSIPEMINLGIASDQAKLALIGYAGSSAEAEKFTIAVGNAANGTISELDAMQNAARLLSMGLAINTTEAAKLTEMAITLGASMGKGPAKAFEDFTLMLANQSIPRLDTFGISAGQVRERMEQLADENKNMDRQTRFMIATMEIGEVALNKLGEAGFEAGTDIDRLTSQIDDLKVEIGQKLAPVASGVAGDILRVFGEIEKQSIKLNDEVANTTSTFGEWKRTLGLSVQFWALLNPEFNEYLRTTEYLNAEVEQGTRTMDGWSAGIHDNIFAVEEAEEAIRNYAGELDTLSEIVDNKVGQAYDRFIEKQDDLNESIADLEGEILELEGAEYITPDQLKQIESANTDIEFWEGWVEKLEGQIDELNKYSLLTDEQKAQLAQANADLETAKGNVEGAEESIEGLNELKLVTEDQAGQLDSLNEKLGEQQEKIKENEEAFDKQTKKMIFNMLAQKLAASEVGEEIQVKLLTKVAEGFDLMNDAQITATTGIIEGIGAIGEDGSVKKSYDIIMDLAGLPAEKTFTMNVAVNYNVQDIQTLSGSNFQHGGSFTVGGQGVDQTPVSFMATRGERVTITPPGAKRGGGRNIVINFSGPVYGDKYELERVILPIVEKGIRADQARN